MSQRQQLERRAEELQLASDASNLILERGANPPLPPPTTTYLGGHSYGGPAALLAAATAKTKVDGLLLHDPAIGMNGGIDAATGNAAEGRRIASFTSDEYDRAGVRCGATYHVAGGFHGNFVDAPLWAPLWVMRPLSLVIPAAGPAEPEEVHAGLARAAARFMREGAAAEGLGTAAPGLLEWRGR
jgi:pimeloyl-ACP methyl ester carboxylesterase